MEEIDKKISHAKKQNRLERLIFKTNCILLSGLIIYSLLEIPPIKISKKIQEYYQSFQIASYINKFPD